MTSLAQRAQGARLERMRASPRWAGEGFRNLDEGQLVEFTIEDSPKGPQAADVVILDQEGISPESSAPVD